MAQWRNLAKSLALADGAIGEREALIIRKELLADKNLDREEMEFLFELRREAKSVVPSFAALVNEVIKKAVLKDGVIGASEATWLRKWIVADGKLKADEKQLLEELRKAAKQVSPEFQTLYDACMKA